MKTYTIYTKRIAYLLRKQGFKFIETGINPHFPQFNTYIFEDSAELRKAFAQIVNK